MKRASAEKLRPTPNPGAAWLGQLGAGIGTPLGAAVDRLSALVDGARGPLSPEQREDLIEVRRRVEEATRLVCDLVDLARLEAGELPLEPHPFDLTDTMRALVQEREATARARGVRLAVSTPSRSLPPVIADALRVSQVLGQLVDHAVGAMDGGQVTISTELYNRSIAVHVTDSGPGFQATALASLLRDPEPLQLEGPRLGFALCRRLVSRMGGDLWGSSNPGEGSRFSFTVPRGADDSGAESPSTSI